ncbi:hypothetical protein [Streptomyces sp. ASQP_92]
MEGTWQLLRGHGWSW